MADEPVIKKYTHAAGGWAPLKSSTHVVREQKSSIRSLLRVNQPQGFDCPGCAWPDPKDTSAFEFCENGVKAVAWETTGRRVGPDFFEQHTVTELAEKSNKWLESQGRLTHPMRYDRESDRYVPVAWHDAFALVGDALRTLDDPDQAIFYTSGRTSNEAAFLYQLFVRLYGTNNMPDCSNMCHESSGCALGEAIGIGKGTVTLDDFERADAIFVIGQNPGTNHPRMLTELQRASERGATIVSFNPLRERGLEKFAHPQRPLQMLTGRSTTISQLYLQPLIAGDLAALKGVMKHVFEFEAEKPGEILDHAFIKEHTVGFEQLKSDIENESWETVQTQSGLSREQLLEVAEIYVLAQRVIICWAMGVTQNRDAVATIQQIVNLLLMRGNIGKRGAGACPVRGHSNVQGDRTMGIVEKPKDAFLDRLAEVFAFDPPRQHGHDTVAAIQAMHEGRAKVFVGMGGNFAQATPDTPHTEAALARCDLTVHVSTKLNRSHITRGRDALILPCLGRSEIDQQTTGPQRVTVEDSMSMVHASQGKLAPASEHLLSEPAIIAGIAKATLADTPDSGKVDWDALIADYDKIRDLIAAVLPEAFHDYNKRLDMPGGFYLGNAARSRIWNTASGKAQFTVAEIPDLTLPQGQLRMMTMRSHDQYNTTVYDDNDRYRGIQGTRHVVFMHKADIESRGLTHGEKITIRAQWDDGRERIAQGFQVVEYDIPQGCCATYFPEANVLVSVGSYAKKSRTPMSKFVPVTVEKL